MVTNIPKKHRFSATLDAFLRNLAKTGRGRKQAFSMVVDSSLVVMSLWLAYSLRHGQPFSDFYHTWYLFVIMPVATVIVFMSLGIYRWVIRSSNRNLFRQLVKACIVSGITLLIVAFLAPPVQATPRSLFAIYGMLLVIGTTGVRFIWQGLFDSGSRGEPVAIYGAGIAGQQLVQSMALGHEYQPKAFIDDNKLLADSTIAGIAVLDAQTPELMKRLHSLDVERVILAMPSISAADYQKILSRFDKTGLSVQTIPTVAELMSGKASVGQIRDVSISDILGRSEVPPDMNLIGQCVKNQVVLVTGGGGSIGSELCRQILMLAPSKLIVLDNSEPSLYYISEELQALIDQHELTSTSFLPVLGTVTNRKRIDALLLEHRVNTVYHAAAYKHLPIVQSQPEEGVRVNVFGTQCVLEAAMAHDVANFVLISTDKAVRPTNSMGASKRTAELILQAKAREESNTIISMVRFGNVLGSSGSVVPKFKKQIEAGGPITLTDKNITRYFMTIPEAAQLVLQASAVATGGDVFVLDMGEPVRIEDLAITMVGMLGKRLKRDTGNDADIEIVIDGLRDGEKMFEELFIDDGHQQTEITKVFTANEAWITWEQLAPHLTELRVMSDAADRQSLSATLLDLAFSGQIELAEASSRCKVGM